MIEQTARVVSLKQGYAWVEPDGQSGCGGCASKSNACGQGGLFSFSKPSTERLYVANPLHAKPGDRVVVGMRSGAFLLYSLLAYLFPLLSMLVFAMLAQELFTAVALPADTGALLGGAAGLASGFFAAAWLAKVAIGREGAQPVILRHHEVRVQATILPVTQL